MTNKKLGNDFESEFCEFLGEHGFWVHNMAQNKSGQPADVIAVKNQKAYLIDCKVCSDGKFPVSRVEDNQHYAMQYWKLCGNGDAWFAMKMPNGQVYMVPYRFINLLRGRNLQKALDSLADTAERWASKCG